MNAQSRWWHTVAAALLAGSLFLLMPGCGASKPEQAAAPEPLPVDPRYASADALVAYINSFNVNPPRDGQTLVDLFYAETEEQKRMVGLIGRMAPLIELGAAMQDRFGDIGDQSMRALLIEPGMEVHITQRLDRRAIAEGREADGSRNQFHLVQYDRRWWISGYTFEYDRETKALMSDPRKLEAAEYFFGSLGEIVQPVIMRVRAGHFSSPEAVVGDIFKSATQWAKSNPDGERRLEEAMELLGDLAPRGRR